MMYSQFLTFILAVNLSLLVISIGVRKKSEQWGYVNVRDNAYMFWWLYYHTGEVQNAPLIMWLQGGPGASSTGFGNFAEIGPLDEDLKPRNMTWLQSGHLLFVDNPVGSGFSYVTSESAYTKDVEQISEDLLTLMKNFMKQYPEFQNIPFYIFSESYGGKMTAAFGATLFKAIQNKEINCNFKGVALGDSWISPIHSLYSWAPYLYMTSFVDEMGLKTINDLAKKCKDAIDSGNWKQATDLFGETQNAIENVTDYINFYNILNKEPVEKNSHLKLSKYLHKSLLNLYHKHVGYMYNDKLFDLMNGPIRKKLQIIPKNITWGGQSGEVFFYQSEDFMKPVINKVDELLNDTIKVIIYNGQLDLIVDTPGQSSWILNLGWPKLINFLKDAHRQPLYIKKPDTAAFVKTYENLSFYWILKAGHMVPADNPEMALKMIKILINPSLRQRKGSGTMVVCNFGFTCTRTENLQTNHVHTL